MSRASWFEELFGFDELEHSYEERKAMVKIDGEMLVLKNNKTFRVGRFETPSLAELRKQGQEALAKSNGKGTGKLRVSLEYGDVSSKHGLPNNKRAVFQAASQFNCLEFVGPRIVPESGITQYVMDRTQGPACAISCGAGTFYRNYFASVPLPAKANQQRQSQEGQTKDHQIENLADLEKFLDNLGGRYFKVVGGYTIADDEQLTRFNRRIDELQNDDAIREQIRVGVQYDVQVTATNWGRNILKDPDQYVTQVYAAACAVAYNSAATMAWKKFATLVLEASYEATLWAAVINAANHNNQHGSNIVFLTQLGGGVFGNSVSWISQAMDRSFEKFRNTNLDVRVVAYSSADADFRITNIISKYQ